MHLDEETLERVLHDELDATRGSAAREHLSGCPECSAALEEARRREARIFTLLEELDEPAPEGRGIDARTRPLEGRVRHGGPWVRIAAAVAFVVVAGGALALPGSPLRKWIRDLRGPGDEPTDATGAVAGPHAPGSGITVVPAGPFRIVFLSRQDEGFVRVRLSEEPEVQIHVTGTPVALESATDRLTVENGGSRSTYDIRLPASGPLVEIHLADRTVLRSVDGVVSTDAPGDPAGGWRIELTGP